MRKLAPALTLVVLDESIQTINDGFFGVLATGNRFWDVPSSRHSRGCNFNFGDGHVQHWRWKDARTVAAEESQTTANNLDLQRFQQAIGSQ
jgi:prepilin-type processing-associated H-X9-DG protein